MTTLSPFPSPDFKSAVALARQLMLRDSIHEATDYLEGPLSPTLAAFRKDAANLLSGDVWGSEGGEALAASAIGSVADVDALTALFANGVPLSMDDHRALVATGWVGDSTLEGAPKAQRQQLLSVGKGEPVKSTGLIVMTQELLDAGGAALERLFEQELEKALVRGSNQQLVDLVQGSDDYVEVPSTGDATQDVVLAVSSANPADSYLVMSDLTTVTQLALNPDPRSTVGTRGGQIRPGIQVIATASVEGVLAIPISLIGYRDHGMSLLPASHASLQLVDEPSNNSATPTPTALIGLFQDNARALLAERRWEMVIPAGVVSARVGGTS